MNSTILTGLDRYILRLLRTDISKAILNLTDEGLTMAIRKSITDRIESIASLAPPVVGVRQYSLCIGNISQLPLLEAAIQLHRILKLRNIYDGKDMTSIILYRDIIKEIIDDESCNYCDNKIWVFFLTKFVFKEGVHLNEPTRVIEQH